MKRIVAVFLSVIIALSLLGCNKETAEIIDTTADVVEYVEETNDELDLEVPEYVHASKTGTYNRDIITDTLLSAPSNLPEVTQGQFPSDWKGAGLDVRKGFVEEYMPFEESDIAFLHENGFNFTRLFFHFQTLRYPDFPEDPYLINMRELEDLDRLLAWCMQYDVHLQISMRGYLDENGVNEKESLQRMPQNDKAWALTQAYWTMLTERYAGIPSKYLSFDLCNEIQPEPNELDKQKEKLGEMVGKMRAIDPNRVLLYSQWNMGNIEWTEAFASLGIGVGCHPYAPSFITSGDLQYLELNPYAQAIWPMPYFPTGKVMGGEEPLQISGDVEGAEMRIHIWYSNENPVLGIYADGKLIETIRPEGGRKKSGDYFYYDKIYSVRIPDNAKNVTLRVEQGFARIDTIIFEKNGVITNMMPCDTLAFPDYTDPLPLIVHGDGTYSNSENLVYDAESIYRKAIEPYQKIAQQYDVGFMVNEFGMFGTLVHWDINIVTAFHETYLKMLEDKDIPWCYCETANIFPKHLLLLFHEESQWAGATEEDISYTLKDGSVVTLKVCKELLDTFRAYTLKP